MTIIEAVKEVMRRRGEPMTIREVYDDIIKGNLYIFHAENPFYVVAGQIRRYCKGIDFPSASEKKHFELIGKDKFYLFSQPPEKRIVKKKNTSGDNPRSLLSDLKNTHFKYDIELRAEILANICRLDPRTFEEFGRRLLQAYGFVEMQVTQYSKDGGIDGYGKLKVGLAHLNVAFQCKQFRNKSVGRPEIDKFRGAIQGQFEQGIFFTTSSFASGAESTSFRVGAVPIILIDGKSIVDLMIEKQFGVQVEHLPVYSYALDLIFSEEDDSAKVP